MTDGVTTVVSYYSFGGLRIAVKLGNTLFHLHGDHLGSTSLTTRGSSETANRADYAYCAERSATGDLQTDYTFTGQKRDATGLMYYNARYYDPALGTSVSPDSLIPVPKHAISFNRFLCAKGHPLKFTDPGGHCGFSQQGKGGTLRISEYDCTVDDFDALSWDERVLWLELFVEEANLQEWFHDIRGVITDLFIGDEAFENREGFIAYMDAAILQALNDGWRLSEGKDQIGHKDSRGVFSAGGVVWAEFIRRAQALKENKRYTVKDIPPELDKLRLQAEQHGVDYAMSLQESQSLLEKTDSTTRWRIEVFLWGADRYRALCPCLGINARTGWPFLGASANVVDSVVRTTGEAFTRAGEAQLEAARSVLDGNFMHGLDAFYQGY